jgi:hypothetical protein
LGALPQVDPAPAALATLPQRLSAALAGLLDGDALAARRAAALGERLRATDGAAAAARLVLQFASDGRAASGSAAAAPAAVA